MAAKRYENLYFTVVGSTQYDQYNNRVREEDARRRRTDGISVASTVLAMRALRRAVKTEPTHDLLLRGVSKIIRYVIIITVTMCGCPSVMSQVVTVM